MIFKTFQPSPYLREYVRFFWALESSGPYTHHSMATACPELVFHYDGQFEEVSEDGSLEKSFSAGLHGQTTLPRRFTVNRGFGMFGAYLFPQTVPLVFGYASTACTNQMTDLHLLVSPEHRHMEDEIASAAGHPERIIILEKFLIRKLSKKKQVNLPVFDAIKEIIQQRGLIKIRQLASDHCLSERQFERQFREYSGFTPKLFSRITRFHQVLEQYGKPGRSLTDIAYDSGYYDQSHFIHEFQEFSGMDPKAFFSGESAATDWRE